MAVSGKRPLPSERAPKAPEPGGTGGDRAAPAPPGASRQHARKGPATLPPGALISADTDVIDLANVDRSVANEVAIPNVGDRIGHYVVERLIGSGGMGLVVAARHDALGELVAIKLLRPKAARDKVHAERFAREARAIIKIKSEHVVRVLDAGTLDGGAPYIVMEYLVGRDLAAILKEGPIPLTRAADYMLQVCEAVASAHAASVVHRDLKPSNFFVTQRADGTPLVKVLDFGISKAIGQEGVADPNLTETQAVFGSPTYMSPEQIRSAKHVDHRSDVWSLGVGLFELLTGRLPFAGDNVAGLLASIVADPPFFPHAFVPDLPEQLEDLLLACLQKDPNQRVSSVAELAYRLAPFATQNVETHNLVERIQRLGTMTSANAGETSSPQLAGRSTTGPKLPQGSYAQISVPVPIPSASHDRVSGSSYGSTGMDLSSEARPSSGSRSMFAGIAIGLGVAVLLIGVGAYVGAARAPAVLRPPSETPPMPSAVVTPVILPPAPTPVDPTISAVASVPTVASSPATPSAKPITSTKKPKRGPPRSTAGTATTTTKTTTDPTGDRF